MGDGASVIYFPQEEEKDYNVIDFPKPTLIVNNDPQLGGKEPPSSSGGDWLSDLEEGSIFYVQSKTNPMDFSLPYFRLLKKEGDVGDQRKVIVLQAPKIPEGIPVNPVRFCNNYLLYKNMGVITYKEEEENSHDDDHRHEQANGHPPVDVE